MKYSAEVNSGEMISGFSLLEQSAPRKGGQEDTVVCLHLTDSL